MDVDVTIQFLENKLLPINNITDNKLLVLIVSTNLKIIYEFIEKPDKIIHDSPARLINLQPYKLKGNQIMEEGPR